MFCEIKFLQAVENLFVLFYSRYKYFGLSEEICHCQQYVESLAHVGWLVGCFGFNGPLRRLYRAGERTEK